MRVDTGRKENLPMRVKVRRDGMRVKVITILFQQMQRDRRSSEDL